jgi:phosphoribosyl 1,2-cyclic phosphodiesterase
VLLQGSAASGWWRRRVRSDTGGEFDRYGGHTSCLAIAHDGERPSLIIDAGTGIGRPSDLLGNGPGLFNAKPYTGAIVLGHMHWDHT